MRVTPTKETKDFFDKKYYAYSNERYWRRELAEDWNASDEDRNKLDHFINMSCKCEDIMVSALNEYFEKHKELLENI